MAAAAASGLCAEWSGPIQGGGDGGRRAWKKGRERYAVTRARRAPLFTCVCANLWGPHSLAKAGTQKGKREKLSGCGETLVAPDLCFYNRGNPAGPYRSLNITEV